MPIYKYKCKNCCVTFEILHSIKEIQETCIECGSTKIQKIFFIPKTILFDGIDDSIEKRVEEFAQEKCLAKAQEDLKKQKENLRKRDFKENQ